jgi:hypothetical protein
MRAHGFVTRAHQQRGWGVVGARMNMRAYLAVHAAASCPTPVATLLGARERYMVRQPQKVERLFEYGDTSVLNLYLACCTRCAWSAYLVRGVAGLHPR